MRILCIDSEQRFIESLQKRGHMVFSCELGYKSGKCTIETPPNEVDAMIFNLEKPACFDYTKWGIENNNYTCKIEPKITDKTFIDDKGRAVPQYQLLKDSHISASHSLFNVNDIIRAIEEAGRPLFVFLNYSYMKHKYEAHWGQPPDFTGADVDYFITKLNEFERDERFTETLPDLFKDIPVICPLRVKMKKGQKIHRHIDVLYNNIGDSFSKLLLEKQGFVWLLPEFVDNSAAISYIIDHWKELKEIVEKFRFTFPRLTDAGLSQKSQIIGIEKSSTSDKPIDDRNKKISNKESSVFVVHGRNLAIKTAMFQFLRSIGVNPIEWGEAKKATKKTSPYVGEILNKAFSEAQAIIVLFTPDDEARLRGEFRKNDDEAYEKQLTPQARPNVIFEAGMAFGYAEDRTIIVEIGKLRPFSDIAGRHTIKFDGTPRKRHELINALKTAGVSINIEGKNDWLEIGYFEIQ